MLRSNMPADPCHLYYPPAGKRNGRGNFGERELSNQTLGRKAGKGKRASTHTVRAACVRSRTPTSYEASFVTRARAGFADSGRAKRICCQS